MNYQDFIDQNTYRNKEVGSASGSEIGNLMRAFFGMGDRDNSKGAPTLNMLDPNAPPPQGPQEQYQPMQFSNSAPIQRNQIGGGRPQFNPMGGRAGGGAPQFNPMGGQGRGMGRGMGRGIGSGMGMRAQQGFDPNMVSNPTAQLGAPPPGMQAQQGFDPNMVSNPTAQPGAPSPGGGIQRGIGPQAAMAAALRGR